MDNELYPRVVFRVEARDNDDRYTTLWAYAGEGSPPQFAAGDLIDLQSTAASEDARGYLRVTTVVHVVILLDQERDRRGNWRPSGPDPRVEHFLKIGGVVLARTDEELPAILSD